MSRVRIAPSIARHRALDARTADATVKGYAITTKNTEV